MRILALNKRQYTGKDLLDDKYGRLYEIPEALQALGHEVRGLALSYRRHEQGFFRPGAVLWQSVNLLSLTPTCLNAINNAFDAFRPEVVIASSDVFHAILAWQICLRRNIPFVIDCYDNYESFGASRIPGVVPLFRAACRAATGVTVVSRELKEFVVRNYGVRCPLQVIKNAIPRNSFSPQSRIAARAALGLPLEARIIGTAGSISAKRGSEVMFEAFLELAKDDPDLWLAHAGPCDNTPKKYRHEKIVDLGVLKFESMPLVFNALDVAVICNLDSTFGRYCFPQKFYEIVACGTPLVAADVGEMRHLLNARPDCLFAPKDALALAARIRVQLVNPSPITGVSIPDWPQVAEELNTFIKPLLK